MKGLWLGFLAGIVSSAVTAPLEADASVHHALGLTKKKGAEYLADGRSPPDDSPLLATFVQVHTGERVAFDARSPSIERFSRLLADRVTGSSTPLDPRLLELLRTLVARYPGARIELVSGFRSPKLNEMLRKKGHHVASHSQHSLGHACDFRIVPDGAVRPLAPSFVERQIRAAGWEGGVGIYPTQKDWFVHADVGPNRRWVSK
ncbi:YcbK family protein [Pendulispora albinea]|uniref:Murein endopeptidase K n=1 Tax=Pendulispora albinea TaxID=2741071 RepID=A0ABZ2M634_9BACT